LAAILPYSNAAWEKLSIFLNFLIPKLPAPKEEDLSRGIIETIDLDSYRVEVRSALDITLADEDSEVEPVPTSGAGLRPETEIDYLSNIIREFNDRFPDIDWKDKDKILREIQEGIPAKVAEDKAYQNAIENSDRQNARIEHDQALERVMVDLMADFTELFKQYSDNPDFRRWLSDRNFHETYSRAGR
jgi:type I restriction enzyme R subunit